MPDVLIVMTCKLAWCFVMKPVSCNVLFSYLHYNPSNRLTIGGHVEENFWQTHFVAKISSEGVTEGKIHKLHSQTSTGECAL